MMASTDAIRAHFPQGEGSDMASSLPVIGLGARNPSCARIGVDMGQGCRRCTSPKSTHTVTSFVRKHGERLCESLSSAPRPWFLWVGQYASDVSSPSPSEGAGKG